MVRKNDYPGTVIFEESKREKDHRKFLRSIAAECIVLLENQGVLPLKPHSHVALYGRGVTRTIKSGNGSAAVNERSSVSIFEGMKNAGFHIDSMRWIEEYEGQFREAKQRWIEEGKAEIEANQGNSLAIMKAIDGTRMKLPKERDLTEKDLADTKACETAIYVLSRVSGEGTDRCLEKGDYYLTDDEKILLRSITEHYAHTVVILNSSGIIDLSFLDEMKIDALLQIGHLGMEGGNAVADVICGKCTPSGKLTDTWACEYQDYPNASTYSHLNGNLQTEKYQEGIYVGYRYFDAFRVKPRYCFGYGLSYTEFTYDAKEVSVTDTDQVIVKVRVKNSGNHYAGKAIVQIYAACPGAQKKYEVKRLCGFEKTELLQPGGSQEIQVAFPIAQLLDYNEEEGAYLLQKGDYTILLGTSSEQTEAAAILRLDHTVIWEKLKHICKLQQPVEEIVPEASREALITGDTGRLPVIHMDQLAVPRKNVEAARREEPGWKKAEQIADTLTTGQMIELVNGDSSKSQITTIGGSGISVPGSAGETSPCLSKEPWNLPSIVFADGSSGLRLQSRYWIDEAGEIVKEDFSATAEHGIFSRVKEKEGWECRYQFCSAIPSETALAQSWNLPMLEACGKIVGTEMKELGIHIWLAPGLNIHRNPLCGRNFEYFSEDPLLSGMFAAALARGVQSLPGVGVCIKHFACNNQEENRKGMNVIIGERTLRQIYLHGFEIAVKTGKPKVVMSSYNKINGVHAANSADLLRHVLRDEWDFRGIVISDWVTTGTGGSSPVGCVKAGNDIIMPGTIEDMHILEQALQGQGEEALTEDDLKKCCVRIICLMQELSKK